MPTSFASVVMSIILIGSVFTQLYLLSYNTLSGTSQEVNRAYAAKQFKIRIDVDQDPIQLGDTQKITVIVRDANTNNKISDAFVRIAIDPHSGKIATGSSRTDDNGETTFKVKIGSSTDTGTYDVAARASGNGYAAKTVTTSFEVVDNNNNNGNNDHNSHDHSGGNNNNNNNNDQVQVISQSNECGNGQGSSDVNCQNIANQIQGSGNAVNVIGVQSGGGNGDGDSNHGHDRNSGGNDGQTGQIGVQQSGSSGGGGGEDGNNGHGHRSQSQAASQANVCGNGKSAHDVNCQNVANQIQSGGHNRNGGNGGKNQAAAQTNACGNGNEASHVNCQNIDNQIQGSGNAVNVIGSQTSDTKGGSDLVSRNDGSNKEFVKGDQEDNTTSSSSQR